MTPTNILQRTYQIKYNNTLGTCFTIDVDKRQYIITARHVLESISNKDVIEIYHENQWKKLEVRLVGVGQNEFDITVLATNVQISPCHSLIPTVAELCLSQDIYFLGFPYGIRADIDAHLNAGFPLPLIKKGIISAMNYKNNVMHSVLIDGLNNPGFSGGPVYFQPMGQKEKHCVAAIISSYRYNWEPIYLQGVEIDAQYQFNTGIVIAYTINHAMDLINNNPIGFIKNS